MPDQRDSPSATVPPVVASDDGIAVLDPKRDEAAAAILASATGEGTSAAGALRIAAARGDVTTDLYGLDVNGELVAVYALAKRGQAVELSVLAVAEGRQRRGYGTRCLHDALRRAGKRPLVVETDDDGLDFYKANGFKIVGKRRHPSGVTRTRLGWHAPRAQPNSGAPSAPLILKRGAK